MKAVDLIKEYMQWRKGKVPSIQDQIAEAVMELAERVEALEAKEKENK